MTNPIDRATMTVRQTSPRMTPIPASRRFGEVLAQGGRALLQGALSAATFVPGGALLSAAVRGAVLPALQGDASSINSVGGANGGAGGEVYAPNLALEASPAGAGSTPDSPADSATGGARSPAGSTGSGGLEGDDILSRGQEQSIRMLRLQEAISEENRRYTALSNVLHARHEMAKNAIGNIR